MLIHLQLSAVESQCHWSYLRTCSYSGLCLSPAAPDGGGVMCRRRRPLLPGRGRLPARSHLRVPPDRHPPAAGRRGGPRPQHTPSPRQGQKEDVTLEAKTDGQVLCSQAGRVAGLPVVEVKDCPSSHTHTTFPSSERRRKGIIPGSVCLAAFTGFHIRVCSPELHSVLLGSLECTNSSVFYMT